MFTTMKTNTETSHIFSELHRKVIDSSFDGIVVINHRCEVVSWNRAAERIFKIPPDEILGRNMHEFITPVRYRQRAKEGFEQYQQTGRGKLLGTVIEIEALRADGSEFWVAMSINDIDINDQRWAFAIIRDVTHIKQSQMKLKELAERDPLTHLYNRRSFQSCLEEHLHGNIYLAILDIDFLKRINDLYGHDMGDEAIVYYADALREFFRDVICIARLGGDEFGVIGSFASDQDAVAEFERFRERLSATTFEPQPDIRLSTSIGIGSTMKAGTVARSLLRSADQALYTAKKKGRNTVSMA